MFLQQRLYVNANQARSQNTSGFQYGRKRDDEYYMLGQEPSWNGVVRVGENHSTSRALDKAQQPNDPYSWNKTKPSGKDQENSFSEGEKGKDRSSSEEKSRSDCAKHGDETSTKELADHGAQNVMLKMSPRSKFRAHSSVLEYQRGQNGRKNYILSEIHHKQNQHVMEGIPYSCKSFFPARS